jgi:hypothetical protein
MRSAVDDHFSGRIAPGAERALREHLPSCAECREHYRRHQVLSELDPEGLDPQRRLARGLGLDLRAKRRRLVLVSVPALAAAAAIALLVILWPGTGPDEGGLVSRGGPVEPAPARLEVYRVRPGKSPIRMEGDMNARDELAFAYENRIGRKRLLIFGADEHGNIYWYHPAWQDPAEKPVAVIIEGGAGIRELPEAIGHSIRGETLRIYGVFTDEPLPVERIEALVQKIGKAMEKLPIENVIQESILVRVRH